MSLAFKFTLKGVESDKSEEKNFLFKNFDSSLLSIDMLTFDQMSWWPWVSVCLAQYDLVLRVKIYSNNYISSVCFDSIFCSINKSIWKYLKWKESWSKRIFDLFRLFLNIEPNLQKDTMFWLLKCCKKKIFIYKRDQINKVFIYKRDQIIILDQWTQLVIWLLFIIVLRIWSTQISYKENILKINQINIIFLLMLYAQYITPLSCVDFCIMFV